MELERLPRDAGGWAAALGTVEIPVLARTLAELAILHQKKDGITARDVARVLLHDPMFSLRLLRQVQALRGPGQNADISTVEHALMMLGIEPFFVRFAGLPTIEGALREAPEAYRGLLAVLRRSHFAALCARDWAERRRDTAANEVAVAALLHDLSEMLLWCFAPRPALKIHMMQRADTALRSSVAQREVLGFTLKDLQRELVEQWRLGDLLRLLMSEAMEGQASPWRVALHARVRNVSLAVDLARHSANGWDDAALPDDYAGMAELLKITPEESLELVQRIAQRADLAGDWYESPAVGRPAQDSAGADVI